MPDVARLGGWVGRLVQSRLALELVCKRRGKGGVGELGGGGELGEALRNLDAVLGLLELGGDENVAPAVALSNC